MNDSPIACTFDDQGLEQQLTAALRAADLERSGAAPPPRSPLAAPAAASVRRALRPWPDPLSARHKLLHELRTAELFAPRQGETTTPARECLAHLVGCIVPADAATAAAKVLALAALATMNTATRAEGMSDEHARRMAHALSEDSFTLASVSDLSVALDGDEPIPAAARQVAEDVRRRAFQLDAQTLGDLIFAALDATTPIAIVRLEFTETRRGGRRVVRVNGIAVALGESYRSVLESVARHHLVRPRAAWQPPENPKLRREALTRIGAMRTLSKDLSRAFREALTQLPGSLFHPNKPMLNPALHFDIYFPPR